MATEDCWTLDDSRKLSVSKYCDPLILFLLGFDKEPIIRTPWEDENGGGAGIGSKTRLDFEGRFVPSQLCQIDCRCVTSGELEQQATAEW
jgi:hypothetical protein